MGVCYNYRKTFREIKKAKEKNEKGNIKTGVINANDAQNSNNLRGFSTTNNEINFFQEVKYSNKCRDLNNYNNYMLLTRIDIKKHQKNR